MEPGAQLGHYTVLAEIGRGGMGVVWKAKDNKLGREVAIKTLPIEFAQDADRLARFEREAKLLASLNHPNIAAIYGLEESGETRFLVLELVEGDTLADRLQRGAIRVEESLKLAVQIAEALEAAHEKGVIHRDLKPANIKITPDGRVKVLDFGLAKAFDESAPTHSQSPTLSAQVTAPGVVLGTAAYMSPEQAKGQSVDSRTDVFAFGCVLYECLTGQRAFRGETLAESLAAVLQTEPDWDALPDHTPAGVRRALLRCLHKDLRKRMRDMGDVVLDLAETWTEERVASERPRTRRAWPVLAPMLLILGVVFGYFAGRWSPVPLSSSAEYVGERLGGPAIAYGPVLSPDGTRVAFLVLDDGVSQVAVMQPGSGASQQLTEDTTQGFVTAPAWSPDSSRIYYTRNSADGSGIFSVSALGSASEERPVLDDASDPRPLPDGSLLAVRTNDDRLEQLIRFRPATNETEFLPALLAGGLLDQSIEVLPGGDKVVLVGRPLGAPESENHLYVFDVNDETMRQIAPEITLPPLSWTFPLSATSAEAYFSLPAGDLHQIVAVGLDGSRGVRPVLSLTRRPLVIDVDEDGILYLDQIDQAKQILRMDLETSRVERFPLSRDFSNVLPLGGDRFLLAPFTGSRDRLVVATGAQPPVPFLEVDEEARGPMSLVGDESVAFLMGPAADQEIAVATVDGRLQERIPIPPGATITGLAASPDGATLFYAADAVVYQVPRGGGGDPEPVSQGHEIAVHPLTGDLVILRGGAAPQLTRVPAAGGPETPIPVAGEWQIAGSIVDPGVNLTAEAIGADGRLVARVIGPASWFWPVGILDPEQSDRFRPLFDEVAPDMLSAAWDRDGRVVTLGSPFRSELWRFRPQPLVTR